MQPIKSIDLEAHFYTQSIFDYLKNRQEYPLFTQDQSNNGYYLRFTDMVSLFQTQQFIDILCDIDQARIQIMDKANLEMQVLSFSSPGIDELYPDQRSAQSFASELNDILFDATQRHPKRFKGFAAISPYDVKSSVLELERAITKLGFVGWLAHSNFGPGMYLDDRSYWPLLETAQDLSIPIYLHPTIPLMKEFGSFGFALAGPPFGFQIDAALCLMRMIYAGVFDQFPNLNIILGHMGEALPFLIPERIDWAYNNPNISKLAGFTKTVPNLKRHPSQIIQDNIYITTSGRFSLPLLNYILETFSEDRLLLATDYPYENLTQTMRFIKESKLSSKLIHKICYENAQHLLRLD